MAFLPLIVVPMLEYFVLRTHLIGDAIESRFNQLPLFSGTSTLENIFDDQEFISNAEVFSLLAYIDIGKFLTSPAMWAGVVVCGLFITAAIYVRRYRDDS